MNSSVGQKCKNDDNGRLVVRKRLKGMSKELERFRIINGIK